MPVDESSTHDIRTQAREILAAMSEWYLRPADWCDVETILADLRKALAESDQGRLRQLTGELFSIASLRVEQRITNTEPISDQIRERANELVDTIDPPAPDAPESEAVGENDAASAGH